MRNLVCRSAPREPTGRMSHIIGPVTAMRGRMPDEAGVGVGKLRRRTVPWVSPGRAGAIGSLRVAGLDHARPPTRPGLRTAGPARGVADHLGGNHADDQAADPQTARLGDADSRGRDLIVPIPPVGGRRGLATPSVAGLARQMRKWESRLPPFCAAACSSNFRPQSVPHGPPRLPCRGFPFLAATLLFPSGCAAAGEGGVPAGAADRVQRRLTLLAAEVSERRPGPARPGRAGLAQQLQRGRRDRDAAVVGVEAILAVPAALPVGAGGRRRPSPSGSWRSACRPGGRRAGPEGARARTPPRRARTSGCATAASRCRRCPPPRCVRRPERAVPGVLVVRAAPSRRRVGPRRWPSCPDRS